MKRLHPLVTELRRDRLAAGLTVQEAADLLYLSPAAFYKRESGDCEPATLADIDRWAALFGKRVALVPANTASAATPRMFHAVVDPLAKPDAAMSTPWTAAS